MIEAINIFREEQFVAEVLNPSSLVYQLQSILETDQTSLSTEKSEITKLAHPKVGGD